MAVGTRPTKLTELEQELQRAVEEIERGECSVLSVEDVDRWAETGVPPWSDDFG
jgi:DNA invertase Pin-like site-specific DNA recombinase